MEIVVRIIDVLRKLSYENIKKKLLVYLLLYDY